MMIAEWIHLAQDRDQWRSRKCRGFFKGEGPRSRYYEITAALRLLVQPFDENEDDYYFCPFPSSGA
jgi:hypothetical protein